ncbi:hypothetical protein D3C76_1160430 [compost metagenome]
MPWEARLDLLDHLRRVAHRVELIQGQGQAVADDIYHCGHLHDVEVHADVQGLTRLDALAGAALAAAEGVVNDPGIVLEAGFVLLPERARVHLAARGIQLLGRDVAALQRGVEPALVVWLAVCLAVAIGVETVVEAFRRADA